METSDEQDSSLILLEEEKPKDLYKESKISMS